ELVVLVGMLVVERQRRRAGDEHEVAAAHADHGLVRHEVVVRRDRDLLAVLVHPFGLHAGSATCSRPMLSPNGSAGIGPCLISSRRVPSSSVSIEWPSYIRSRSPAWRTTSATWSPSFANRPTLADPLVQTITWCRVSPVGGASFRCQCGFTYAP